MSCALRLLCRAGAPPHASFFLRSPAAGPNFFVAACARPFSSPPSRQEVFGKYPVEDSVGSLVREAWLEHLGPEGEGGGGPTKELLPLHPDIWSVRPRIDIIQRNIDWQTIYKKVSYIHLKTRHELPGKGARPWPQKGTGRARHASIRSPLWAQGGKARGARNPRTYYHMIPYSMRVNGLIHTLAVKFAQDDVHVVRDLDIPSSDPAYIDELIDRKGWALSTLFVDTEDIFPDNITEATDAIDYVNLIPSYGLNVHSMLKHKTLVLTLPALNHLEDRLLRALRRLDRAEAAVQSRDPMKAAKPMQDPGLFKGPGEYHRPMPGDPHRPILW